MNENNEKTQIRTPIGVMMDMASNEIKSMVYACMEKNNIPTDLMAYIVKSVLLDVEEERIKQVSEQYVDLQSSASLQDEVNNNGDKHNKSNNPNEKRP